MVLRRKVAAAIACGLTLLVSPLAVGQSADSQEPLSSDVATFRVTDHSNTVGIVTDEAGSTAMQMVSELAAASDQELRVVPIAGLGPLQNLNDLLNLKGVDAAIVQTDVLEHVRQNQLIDDIEGQLRFISRLHNREVHLIARAEQTSLVSLNGKRVNIGPVGSGAAIAASAIFDAAGVSVSTTRHDHRSAIHLIKTGHIDAMVYIGGKPVPLLQQLDPADGLKLLAIPYDTSMIKQYAPSQIGKRDYHGLITGDDVVETISVGTALVAFNWPTKSRGYERLSKLSQLLFNNITRLQEKPRHEKWRNVNFAAALPGWQRHGAAQRGLETISASSVGDRQTEQLRASFKAVLNSLPETASAQQ